MERKVKYDYEFKLQCVNEVLKNHTSPKLIGEVYKLDEANIRKWVRFYNKFGNEGLIPRKNVTYTGDFKLKVIRAVRQKSLSLSDACLHYNIPSVSTLMSWIKKYDKSGIEVLYQETRGKPKDMQFKRAKKKSNKPLTKEEELLKENEYLRAENALLKKFNALIQAAELHEQQRLKP
jgi:transposase